MHANVLREGARAAPTLLRFVGLTHTHSCDQKVYLGTSFLRWVSYIPKACVYFPR